MTDCLVAFVAYASDAIYDQLTCLDIHNLASTHAVVAQAVDAKETQKRGQCATEADRARARAMVEDARLALMECAHVLTDLEHARNAFCDVVRRYLQIFSRRRPHEKLMLELDDTFTRRGVWYIVHPCDSRSIVCAFTLMETQVRYTFCPGRPLHVSIVRVDYGLGPPLFMDFAWTGKLELGMAIVDTMGLPYTFDRYCLRDDRFDDSPILKRVLKHG